MYHSDIVYRYWRRCLLHDAGACLAHTRWNTLFLFSLNFHQQYGWDATRIWRLNEESNAVVKRRRSTIKYCQFYIRILIVKATTSSTFKAGHARLRESRVRRSPRTNRKAIDMGIQIIHRVAMGKTLDFCKKKE